MSTIRLNITMKKAPKRTIPWITTRSDRTIPVDELLAHAGNVEDRLGEDRVAGEQRADVETEQGYERRDRAAKPVTEDDRALGQALGPGRAYVVLLHHVDHLCA